MNAKESTLILSEPLFSIITVCLNDVKGLKRTYSSIMAQSCLDFEWVVVDAVSTDGTVAWLEGLNMPEFTWISEPDDGLYDAMNKGIEMGKGQYILFLNADDELASADVLEKLKRVIQEKDYPNFLYGNTYERTAEGKLLHKASGPYQRLWYGMFAYHQSILYQRTTMGDVRYRLEYSICSDYAFTGEVLARADHIVQLPFEVSVFAQGGLSSYSFYPAEKDYWRIKRDIFHHSLLSRIFVRCVHQVMRFVKLQIPWFYRWLRFS